MYSKFRELKGCNLDNAIKDGKSFAYIIECCENKRLKEIFISKELHASKFINLNDILECSFEFEKDSINKHDLENLFNYKTQKHICSFSQNFRKNCTNEHLLWAHYANSHKGIRIDFELDDKYEPKSVKYTDERIFIKSKQDAMNKMDEIMTTKLKCWKYERESRVISDIDKIKINIKQIMLGRGLLRADFEYKDKFDENIIEFAIQIKELINDNKVKILAYTSRYSNDFKEIL